MNIFNIQASCLFLKALALGVLDRYDINSKQIAQLQIILPSRQVCKNFEQIFLQVTEKRFTLLPKTQPIFELDKNKIFNLAYIHKFQDIINSLKITPLSMLERRVVIGQVIKKIQKNLTQIEEFSLIDKVIKIINLCAHENIDISNLGNKNFYQAVHASQIEQIFRIIQEYNNHLKTINRSDPAQYNIELIKNLTKISNKISLSEDIIIAGYAGHVKPIKKLISSLLKQENSYVVLPGLDQYVDEETWSNLDENHPQFYYKDLLNFLDIDRDTVRDWVSRESEDAKNIFISEIFRPSSISHQWKDVKITDINHISYIECDNHLQEAKIISMIIRDHIYKNNDVAVISNDKDLNYQIKLALRSYNINIGDSAGETLINSDKATIFLIILQVIESEFSSATFLTLIKHKLFISRLSDQQISKLHQLELVLYRSLFGTKNLNIMESMVRSQNDETLTSLYMDIHNIFGLIDQFHNHKKYPFKMLLEKHIESVEKMVGFSDSNQNLYSDADGKELHLYLMELLDNSSVLPEVTFDEYINIFTTLLKVRNYHCSNQNHSNIKIYSSEDAKYITSDSVIVAGLNEGYWPMEIDDDPWFDITTRNFLKLGKNNAKISIFAHDLFSLLFRKNVYLTRSIYIAGSPSIASRWLARIISLAKFFKLNINDEQQKWKAWLKEIYYPKERLKLAKPFVCPPIDKRPTKFSVTKIEKLINNPYGIYASLVLGLNPLPEIDKMPNHADFGNFIHQTLDHFNKNFDYSIEPKNQLTKIAMDLLDKYKNYYVYNFWRAKFNNMIDWLLEEDKEHRKRFKILTENNGMIKFIINGIEYIITAKADKILQEDNDLYIIDYKTGKIPSLTEIKNHTACQLSLESLIASKSGFHYQDNDKSYNIISFSYILIKGNINKPEIRVVNLNDQGNENFLEQINVNLISNLEFYSNPDNPYHAYPQNKISPYDEYIHFARVKEWGSIKNNSNN